MVSRTSQPPPPRRRTNPLSAIGLATLLFMCMCLLSIVASPAFHAAKLTCHRVETGAPVDCSIERSILFLIPLGSDSVSDLRRATVSEYVDQDGDLSHRVELATAQGVVPLTSIHIAGSGRYQADLAASLNDFILGGATGSVVVTDYLFSAMSATTAPSP